MCRWAQDIIACDAAERIIFAIVAGSGSGKLCWHSRGNDNDQENAGYVRESAGGSEQALRLRARDGTFRASARVTFFCCQKKVTKENHSNLRFKDPLARGQAGVAPAGASCFLFMSKESSQRTPLKERGISNFPLSLRILSP